MDNKQAKEIIKVLQDFYSDNRFADTPLNEKDNQALDKAIASLEAWDKVIEEIEKNNPDNYFSDKPIIITKKTVIGIIKKHLKEIEE